MHGLWCDLCQFKFVAFIFQELQRKREEKRTDQKKKAEDEIKFLHDSGKLSKTPAHKSNVKRNKPTTPSSVSKKTYNGDREDGEDDEVERGATATLQVGSWPSMPGSIGRRIDEIFQVC